MTQDISKQEPKQSAQSEPEYCKNTSEGIHAIGTGTDCPPCNHYIQTTPPSVSAAQESVSRPTVAYEANDVGFYAQAEADAYMDYLEAELSSLHSQAAQGMRDIIARDADTVRNAVKEVELLSLRSKRGEDDWIPLEHAKKEYASIRAAQQNWMVMVDEVVAEWGQPLHNMTEDSEAWYWCFADHDLPVADNLSELLVAAAQLTARALAASPEAESATTKDSAKQDSGDTR